MLEPLTAIHRLIEQGRSPEAAAQLREILARDPANIKARTYLGIALYKQGFYSEAIQELKTALRDAPGDREVQKTLQHAFQKYIDYVETLYQRKAYAEAVQHYTTLLSLQPGNAAEIQAKLGLALAKQRKYPEALAELSAALQRDSTLHWATEILAQVQRELSRQGGDIRVASPALPAEIQDAVKGLQSGWLAALEDKTLTVGRLAREARTLELCLYPVLSGCWQTPSLIGLVSILVVQGFLNAHPARLTEPLQELQGLFAALLAKAEVCLLRFGQRVHLVQWIDKFLREDATFKRAEHEAQLRSLALPVTYWADQACIEWLASQGCPASLIKTLQAMAGEQACFTQYQRAKRQKEAQRRYQALIALGKHAWQQAQALAGESSPFAVDSGLRSLIWLNAAYTFAENADSAEAPFDPAERPKAVAECRTLIKQVEMDLLAALGIARKVLVDWTEDDQHRQDLVLLRADIRRKIDAVKSLSSLDDDSLHLRAGQLRQLAREIVGRMKGFIDRLVQACINLLGDPPCEYAFIGFGSLEKQSITPYSDFEFGILVAEETPSSMDYFRRLTCLLQARVTNLGETAVPFSWFQYSFDDVTRMGFCFDLGGKTPLGRYYEEADAGEHYGSLKYGLIHTPDRMLDYVEDEHFATDKLLPVEIGRCTYLTGSEALIKAYHQLLEQRFRQVNEKGQTFYAQRAIALLCGKPPLRADLETYQPQLGRLQEGKAFDVKRDLYRLPDRLIDSVAFFHGITIEGAWEKLAEMQRQGIITPAACRQLQILDGIAMEMRLRNYLHHNRQYEPLIAANEPLLERFYYTALPLYQAVKGFAEAGKEFRRTEGLLARETFYDASPSARIRICCRLGNYEAAKAWLDKAAAENDDPQVWEALGHVHYTAGRYAEAEGYFAKALAVVERQYGTHDPRITGVVTALALTHGVRGHGTIEIDLLKRALEIKKMCHGEAHVEFATARVNLVMACIKAGDGDLAQAKAWLEQDLAIIKNHYRSNPNHIVVAKVSVNLASLLSDPRDQKAHLEKALEMAKNYYGADHVEVAKYLNNLANACGKLKDHAQEKQLLERALGILERHYGKAHVHVATALAGLANAYGSTGDFLQQRDLLQQALSIEEAHYGKDHVELAVTRYNLARALFQLNDPTALTYAEQAYQSFFKHYGEAHQKTQLAYRKLQQCQGKWQPAHFQAPAATLGASAAAAAPGVAAAGRGHRPPR